MTTLIFDWSDWDGPATGHVVVTRRTWRRAPESLHVPWQVVVPVDGRATLDVAHMAGEAVSILWAPRRAASRTDHVLIPDGGEHLAHLLDRVDPSTLEPLPEDLPSAFDLVARAEEAARVATATTATITEASQRAANAAEQARDAATLSQESALSVMPMLSGSVNITPEGGTLAVDLGRAVNVATGLAGTSGAVDVTFPPVTTPDGRVDPDGLGTLLRVDAGADRLTWPGGTVVHGTPPAGQSAMASLVRVGGAVTVVWPPDVVTSVGAGVTAQVAELEQIIGGEVEVQPGGTVMRDAWPGTGAVPAVFVNPYSRPTSSELVLTVGNVKQGLSIGYNFEVYTTHRPGGLKDYILNATVDLGTSGEPVKNRDGWLIAVAPGPAYGDARVMETLSSLAARVPTSTLETFTDGTWGVVLQYNADNPHWEASEWEGTAYLFYNEKDNTAGWEHGIVLTSNLDLPLRADESAYASLGITLPGTFHRASELGDMGVYIG
ncbi:hypothetical protein M3D01_003965 [Micrococcus luteus]|nr:hypothetical protein [Micrococcus luteus]